MKLTIIVALLGFASLTMGSAVPNQMPRFDNYKMYTVFVKDSEQLQEFKKLDDNLPITHLNDVGGAGHSYDVVVGPAHQKDFEERLAYYEFKYELKSNNLQKLIDGRSNSKPQGRSILNPNMNWDNYQSLETIYDWVDSLVLRNLFVVTPFLYGFSYEGRPLKAIRISRKLGNKAIFIEANIHAIEWISSAAGTCFINNLLTSKDENIRRLTWDYDWIFVPVVNPDGFEYTHNVHPLWRKNRKPTGFRNESGICYGTDLNRNFDDTHWGEAGYNLDVPCDHWYAGAAPNSEPEVRALEHFVSSFPKGYIRMYVAMHSYGNLLLLPYGHTDKELPPNIGQMKIIGKAFADAASVKYGTKFAVGSSGQLNYPVSGSGKDWAYNVLKIPFTATMELRDRGTYGFFLPKEQIKPVCEEVTDGYVAMIAAAKAEGLFD